MRQDVSIGEGGPHDLVTPREICGLSEYRAQPDVRGVVDQSLGIEDGVVLAKVSVVGTNHRNCSNHGFRDVSLVRTGDNPLLVVCLARDEGVVEAEGHLKRMLEGNMPDHGRTYHR